MAHEILLYHRRAYPERPAGPRILAWGGQFQWRRDGEHHSFNPDTVYKLQHATRSGSYERFRQYTQTVNDQNKRLCTLRGLMEFGFDRCTPTPIATVEPVESIVKRFSTGAMSYGSISLEAHETLAIAMNRLGGRSNTGEGGEDPSRFLPDDNGDDRRSPVTSIRYAGIPWELGLAEAQQVLVENRLRDRILVQTDGQLRTGRDIVIAALLCAEEYGFATPALVVMGCIMMRVCEKDTCPVGVATQNPELRKRFRGKPEHVVNYFRFLAKEVRELMAQLGFHNMDEMIGRSDLLDMRKAIGHYKAKGLDYSRIFYRPEVEPSVAVRRVMTQANGIDESLDQELLRHPQIRAVLDTPFIVPWCPAVQDLEGKTPVERLAGREAPTAELEMPIRNVHRAVGTRVGSEITRRFGEHGLDEDAVRLKFKGSAGQSFGAFLPRGLSMTLEGDANDYVGKGLSGGKIVVYPPKESAFVPERNIVIGNVALYVVNACADTGSA